MRYFRSAYVEFVNSWLSVSEDFTANTDSERLRESNGKFWKCPIHWRRLAHDGFCVTEKHDWFRLIYENHILWTGAQMQFRYGSRHRIQLLDGAERKQCAAVLQQVEWWNVSTVQRVQSSAEMQWYKMQSWNRRFNIDIANDDMGSDLYSVRRQSVARMIAVAWKHRSAFSGMRSGFRTNVRGSIDIDAFYTVKIE